MEMIVRGRNLDTEGFAGGHGRILATGGSG